MKILTGIDLPFEPSCGSLILCDDIYSELPLDTQVRFLGLKSNEINRSWSKIKDVVLLDTKKVIEEAGYKEYVEELYEDITLQINEFKPDIIHIQHLSFGMALAFSKVKGIPKVAICHGTDILYSIGNDFHKNNVISVCNAADIVIFPTMEMYNDFKRIIKVDLGNKARIVYWGVPTIDEFLRVKNLDGNNIELLYAGRLTEDKGVDIIVKSIQELPRKYNLTIIGSGSHENTIREFVENNNLKNRIRFVPFMPRQALWKQFHRYDAIIISTKEIESFCLVAVEAQAHGLPVIYSNTSGLREVIGDSGMSFIPKDSSDLADKLITMFQEQTYEDYKMKSKANANKYKIEDTIKELLRYSRELL